MSDARAFIPRTRVEFHTSIRAYRSRISVISKHDCRSFARVRGNGRVSWNVGVYQPSLRTTLRSFSFETRLRTLILYVLRATWLILQKYFPGILEFDRRNSCGSQPECQRRPRREPLPTPCGWSISTLFRNFRSSQPTRWGRSRAPNARLVRRQKNRNTRR